MDYTKEIIDLAEKSMTSEGFKLLIKTEKKMPDIWDKPSSSTGKYHKKANGSVPTIAHHTYEMLYGAVKIIRMFGGKTKSTLNDAILLSIILHDIQKYGEKGNTPRTTPNHDKTMADLIVKKKKFFLSHFSENEFSVLEAGIRFHSGRWSKSVQNMNTFDFADYPPVVMFVHILDMLSTADVLQFSS